MRWRIAAMTLGLVLAAPALAYADSFNPISIGIGASSLGYGVTLERPLLFNLSARVVTGRLSSSEERRFDGNPYTRTFRESNVLVAGDFRPSSGRWRLSAGVLFGGDRTDYVVRDNAGSYTLNGNTYPVGTAGTVTSSVSYARPAPFAGVGGGTGITRGLAISFDVGAVLRNGTLTTSSTGVLQNDPAFTRDLAVTSAQFKHRFLQPVISVGLTYRP